MLKESIGDSLWAEMTEAQKVDAVLKGQATLKQLSEGLLDGSEKLRTACQDFLTHTGSFEDLPVEVEPLHPIQQPQPIFSRVAIDQRHAKSRNRGPAALKQRFGLPEGFVPRLQRYGRSVLLELNVYRLPNGLEYIPTHPTGTLGARSHLYALLTTEQYLKSQRGSVYVKNDGRIFDYSHDSENRTGDFFDTGYTIYDLERTGRYAPSLRKPRRKRRKSQPIKSRRATAGA